MSCRACVCHSNVYILQNTCQTQANVQHTGRPINSIKCCTLTNSDFGLFSFFLDFLCCVTLYKRMGILAFDFQSIKSQKKWLWPQRYICDKMHCGWSNRTWSFRFSRLLCIKWFTFWSPKRIWRRAFRLTFIRHKNIRCSPSKPVAFIGDADDELWWWWWWWRWCGCCWWWWWDPELVACCGTLRLSSAWIDPWSCLSIISYTESPWINRSSCVQIKISTYKKETKKMHYNINFYPRRKQNSVKHEIESKESWKIRIGKEFSCQS